MPLAAGQTLSHYEILGPLGSGGMGEVYRARDQRLEREVAIKVLPEELAGDSSRLQRFEREARLLASLNHPNIAGIHGVDRDSGVSFLALELVPGNDLEARLGSGPLPIDEAIEVCRQIAEGLEAAHEAGVVHRDLKPANIRVTPDGIVKILDFGLAKRARPEHAGDSEISVEGAVLGTPTYMSPEQARGRPVDRRADVWAFGCVLFECLTGKRAFRGESVAEVLAAVIDREWDHRALPAGLPAPVRTLLERCLDKDPRQRLRDIGEARISLSHPAEAPSPAPGPGMGPRARWALGIAVILAAGALAGRLSVPPEVSTPIRQLRLSEMDGIEQMPAVSPSGTHVAFVSRVNGHQQIYVRPLTAGSPQQITKESADHSFPRWVDDQRLIYRRSDGEGGPEMFYERQILSASSPEPIASAESGADIDPQSRRWLATFRRDDRGPMLVLIDREGREPDEVRRLDEGSYQTPRWSPDGRLIAFEVYPYLLSAEIRVLDVRTGEQRTLVTTTQTRGLAWRPDGSGLVYASSRGSTLPYPPVFTLRTVGLDGKDDSPLPFGGAGYASYEQPDVSEARKLVACRVDLASDIYRYPVAGTASENTAKEEPITHQTGLVQVPSVSPDGKEVVYLSDSGGHANLWVKRLDDSLPRQITKELDADTSVAIPVWSPAGDQIVFVQAAANSDPELRLVSRDGRRAPELLVRGAVGPSWSHTGEWVYFTEVVGPLSVRSQVYRISVITGEKQLVRDGAVGLVVTRDGATAYYQTSALQPGEIWRASPPDSATPTRIGPDLTARIPLSPHQFVLSPDGEWLAGPLKDGETTNLFKIPTRGGDPVAVTDFGSRRTMICRQVSWSPDGQWLYAAVIETDSDIVLLDGALD